MNYTEQGENFRVIDDFVLKRTDPFGFWIVTKSKGPAPKALAGVQFTSTSEAAKAVEVFLKNEAKSVKKDK